MTTETMPAVEPLERVRTASDVLLAAARYIEEHGWTQYSLGRQDGSVCVLGAINAVLTGDPEDDHGSDPARALFQNHIRANGLGFYAPEFNDLFARTEAEVLAALRAAAR